MVVFGIFFFQTYQEYAQLRRIESESRERLTRAERRLRDQERILQRLRTDPEFVEKVIRQQLRYAKPDELIFRFEDLPSYSRPEIRGGIITPRAR
ncbi:MAG: hypothetical protein A3G75_13760 [Verrucomicrobia bacterium RIFCSPLOWO2_12_FULL_64_8]|nr:MAG: hypothetical protein A3G75_13760 [Verrucomicrobia bacterium RIFCSPLOWO2_12_FULL_64_8]